MFVTAELEYPRKFRNGNKIGAVQLLDKDKPKVGYKTSAYACTVWLETPQGESYVKVEVDIDNGGDFAGDWVKSSKAPGVGESIKVGNKKVYLAVFDRDIEPLYLADDAVTERKWENSKGILAGSGLK